MLIDARKFLEKLQGRISKTLIIKMVIVKRCLNVDDLLTFNSLISK